MLCDSKREVGNAKSSSGGDARVSLSSAEDMLVLWPLLKLGHWSSPGESIDELDVMEVERVRLDIFDDAREKRMERKESSSIDASESALYESSSGLIGDVCRTGAKAGVSAVSEVTVSSSSEKSRKSMSSSATNSRSGAAAEETGELRSDDS